MITCKLCFESHTDNAKRLATHLDEIANNQHRMAAEIFQKTWLLFSRPCRCCYSRQGFDMLGLYLKGLYLAKWVRRVEDQTPFACYIKRKGNLLWPAARKRLGKVFVSITLYCPQAKRVFENFARSPTRWVKLGLPTTWLDILGYTKCGYWKNGQQPHSLETIFFTETLFFLTCLQHRYVYIILSRFEKAGELHRQLWLLLILAEN